MDKQEYKKVWAKSKRHPCIDCGKPVSRNSIRCQQCAPKLRHVVHLCVDCGNPVTLWKAQRCRECSDKYVKQQFMSGERSIAPRYGNEHHNWKGGINMQKGGYILIKSPDHPRANRDGYVRQHILVWEEANHKLLPKDWIIHHLNGIKHDNRIRNLVGLPNKKHYLVLQAKAKRIQELEALLNGQPQLL